MNGELRASGCAIGSTPASDTQTGEISPKPDTARTRRPTVHSGWLPAAGDVLYGFGRIDSSGRVADRAVTSVLGWRAGDRLTLTAAAGVVVARRDPGGLVTMPPKPYVAIPAAVRRRCRLEPGDRILLAVFPGEDMLAAYSFAVVDQAMRAHAPLPRGEGGRS